jgi:pimeloyl-ACP methyl ester carboxylesterase
VTALEVPESAGEEPLAIDSVTVEAIMETVHSKDGTPIAYWRSGLGTPLLLVHGTMHDRLIWTPVLCALERHVSVYVMDRRGRSDSGDAPAYALEREWEDIAAVVDAIGSPVDVVGHSFGGTCALEAAGTHLRFGNTCFEGDRRLDKARALSENRASVHRIDGWSPPTHSLSEEDAS